MNKPVLEDSWGPKCHAWKEETPKRRISPAWTCMYEIWAHINWSPI